MKVTCALTLEVPKTTLDELTSTTLRDENGAGCVLKIEYILGGEQISEDDFEPDYDVEEECYGYTEKIDNTVHLMLDGHFPIHAKVTNISDIKTESEISKEEMTVN